MTFDLTITLKSGVTLRHEVRDLPDSVIRDAIDAGSACLTLPLVNGRDLFVCPSEIAAWHARSNSVTNAARRLRGMALDNRFDGDDRDIFRRAADTLEGGR